MINVRSSSLLILTIAAVSACTFTSCRQVEPANDGDRAPVVVTIICNAPGYSSKEAEVVVASPLEAALNGMSNVQLLRSASRKGRVVVWVEFDRDTDFLRARQMVAERTTTAALPEDVALILAPASSGEILLITLRDSTVADTERHGLSRKPRT